MTLLEGINSDIKAATAQGVTLEDYWINLHRATAIAHARSIQPSNHTPHTTNHSVYLLNKPIEARSAQAVIIPLHTPQSH
jgi:hypothetical protein